MYKRKITIQDGREFIVRANDRAFSHLDSHLIVNDISGKAVQSDNEFRASKNCDTLNEHDFKNGHVSKYKAYKITKQENVA